MLLLVFFIGFFLLYWYLFDRSVRLQNWLILAGSYLFYAWADWRFLFLLAVSSLINFWLGILMGGTERESVRRGLLGIGLLQGLGCLLYFKYFHSYLPLGISFYTFKTISYLLDIRRGKIEPAGNWVVFFSYVAFFPCLISGPIDRPDALIPQLEKPRTFDRAQATDGFRQILWGIFKKIVIADNCAGFTDNIFSHYKTQPASALLLGAFLYTIQIYADFSGYSDMAIGGASLLGFRITPNFRYPFFARNIAEFWRRWHISLTSWLKDYVFMPLSIFFRNEGKRGLILAILLTFTAIGIWHGPRWTFLLFGVLHGCYYIPLILRGKMNKRGKAGGIGMIGNFVLVMLTFVIFRSDSLAQALDYYRRIFSRTVFSGFFVYEKVNLIATFLCIGLMFGAEWIQRNRKHPLQLDHIPSFAARSLIYYGLVGIILTFSPTKYAEFIYFRF